MTITCEQARRLIMALSDALEVFEELDDEPEIIINRLHAVIDDLAVRIQVNDAEGDTTPPLPM